MDINNSLIIAGCICGILCLGIVFKIKVVKIVKLIFNSILGGVLIYIINQTELIHIGLNFVTSIIVGILGIPGAILLIAIKMFGMI